jgi:serine/threonine protein kinase
MFDYFSEGSFDVLVLEFQNGRIPIDTWMLEHLPLLGQLFEIVDELSRLSLVHRDLKPDNLIVSGNKIKMFDFTFMISKEAKWGLKELDISQNKNMQTLRALGHGFKPSIFEWDDYYSLFVIFRNLLSNPGLSRTKEQEKMLSAYMDRSRMNVARNSYILHIGDK